MGIKLNINYILRQDMEEPLEKGKEYPFEKSLSYLADDIKIWLTKKDWTPLAEIQITSQTRKKRKTTGTFRVEHVYSETEKKMLKKIFLRMYGWEKR